ncbi:MAG TPA: TlpA disulfide reductase family protein [Steroidobacteraceae bacterium]|nr:TlpA disulfide reductase family protein [Steroidobacteraceae bacterium]
MKFFSRCLFLLSVAVAPVLATSVDQIHTGAPAPQFQLNSNNGKPLSLADLKGRIVLVNFWASWCGPCRKEMPLLEQLNRQYRTKGVTLVGVNVEPDSAAATDWLKATPVSFPILFDVDSKVSKLYQVEGMPNTVILDRKGNVRYIHRGYSAGAENEYLDQIRALIRE